MKTTFQSKVSAGIVLMLALIATLFLFPACTDQEKENTRQSLHDFNAYVKEHKDATANYLDQKWEDMQKEYDEKTARLDKKMDKMDQEMKENYQAAKNDWEVFKTDYLARQAEKEKLAEADRLKTSIIPSDIHTDFSNITGKNVVAVFEHFVNTVDNRKEEYSKEEWININNYWKSLNDVSARLEEANKVSPEDKRRLDGQRIKYTAIKTLNKPFAESETK